MTENHQDSTHRGVPQSSAEVTTIEPIPQNTHAQASQVVEAGSINSTHPQTQDPTTDDPRVLSDPSTARPTARDENLHTLPSCRHSLTGPGLSRAKRSRELTRDERIEIRALRRWAGFSYSQIEKATPFTTRQIRRALDGPLSPKQRNKPHKNKRKLDSEAVAKLAAFLQEDPAHQDIASKDLRRVPGLENFTEAAISSAMRELGFDRPKKGVPLNRPSRPLPTDQNTSPSQSAV